ncbi:MAG TPA: LLM class flavin-dependent oxidoreductase [Candidatus Dormibacteraeota bacterium]
MAQIGIMIEGQEGLNWERWRKLCTDVEALGFASLRRSDHLISLMGPSTGNRDCIDCWTSLALAAEWTSRIEFGPMVTPVTFKHAPILAREAAAVDVLSGGRLILGLGAGWNQPEHDLFQLDLPATQGERFRRLEDAIEEIGHAWEISHPQPVREGRVPLLIGGKGVKRTVPLAARHAAEWNVSTLTSPEDYREAARIVDGACREAGRDPASLKRSVMGTVLTGRDAGEIRDRAPALAEIVPRLREFAPEEVASKVPFGGTPEEIAAKMRPYIEAGVELFMFQHFLLDDTDHLRVIAEELAPQLA